MRFSILFSAIALAVYTQAHDAHLNPSTNYSLRMAESIISRHQGILISTTDRSNLLQAGFTQKVFRKVLQQYPSNLSTPAITSYIQSSIDSVTPVLRNATLDMKFPLDRLSNANGLIYAYQYTKNDTYGDAIDALKTSVDLQPRNTEGSLWYYVYPNYTYLDGMFSLAPFLTLYATHFEANVSSSAMIDDAILQLDLLWEHTYRPSSGLLVHGYDALKRAIWANQVTGASGFVWGRSLGWYCMALIDTLELLPSSFLSAREWIESRFRELMESVVNAVDEESGAWWQIMDMPDRAGNYIESSASAMFVYSLLKGVRMRVLEESRNGTIVGTAVRAYEYLTETFVVDDRNGTLGWNGTVSVCSLNSTATYEYYVGQPILYNSVLGSAAFVLASLEYERLGLHS